VQLFFVQHTRALLKIELLHSVGVVTANNKLLVVELQAFHCYRRYVSTLFQFRRAE
jgi:hypothetical protein